MLSSVCLELLRMLGITDADAPLQQQHWWDRAQDDPKLQARDNTAWRSVAGIPCACVLTHSTLCLLFRSCVCRTTYMTRSRPHTASSPS